MINEHCRIYKVICISKFSAILKILKSARRSEAPLAVMSHLDPSLVLHPRFFSRLLQNDWDEAELTAHISKESDRIKIHRATFCTERKSALKVARELRKVSNNQYIHYRK